MRSPSPGRRFRSVLFDCDSTLSAIEGIDELAGAHRAEVERLTEAAMRGDVPFESVYGERLALARPSRAQVEALGERYVEALVPDAREVVAALRAAGVAVRVVSGGVRQAVLAVARALGVAEADTAAVTLEFDDAGAYAGFDSASPLARSGGKLEMLRRWRDALPRPVMFVGDGATDLEARAAVDCFVAFAGIADHPAVTARADVVVRARSLAPILPLALGGERPDDAAARAVYERGLEMLDPRDRPPPSPDDSTRP